MKTRILIAITLLAIACNEDANPEQDNTVHLAGIIDNGTDGGLGSYWKNGLYSRLGDEDKASRPSSLYVENSSVLIGGSKQGTPTRAVIWKDGVENIIDNSFGAGAIAASKGGKLYATWFDLTLRWVYLKDDVRQPIIDTALNFQPTALALQDDDLFIAGNAVEPTTDGDPHAQTWKNGQLTFREDEVSYTTSIFIHGSDVYMGGYLYNRHGTNVACYWKNGKRIDLGEAGIKSMAKSIYVTDDHIYIAGMINDQAVYWKDGQPIYLTTEGIHSMGNAISVQGDDVHVAGTEHNYPAYWKNDVKQDISNQDKRGRIDFITVGSN